jgi:AcrR family transcriptional regulator
MKMIKSNLRDARERQRRQENRETILHAAEAVILRKGFSATSMDDVAREAQFSKATLYHYFRSKAELIFEILIHFLEDLDNGLIAIQAKDEGVKGKLMESIRLAFRFYAEKENISRVFMMDRSFMKLMQAFITEGNKGTSEVERRFVQKIKAKRRIINDRVKTFLQEGIVSGEFRKIDADATVTFLGAVIQGYFQEKLWNESKPNIEQDIGHFENFILHGIERNESEMKGESK